MNPSARFEALDGWRGICALLVALFHFFALNHFLELRFFRHGYLFVDFFFVLSGFVVRHAYGERVRDGRSYAGYVVRRFGRLWPLHAAVMLGFLIAHIAFSLAAGTEVFSGKFSAPSFATNFLLLHGLGIHDRLTWNGPSWSISTELITYLMFGAVLLLLVRRRLLAYLALALLGGIVVAACSRWYMNTTYDFGLFRCLYGFFVGAALYELRAAGKLAPMPARLSLPLELLAVVATITFVAAAGDRVLGLAAPFVFAFAIWVFETESGPLSRLLLRAPFQKLGRWSYSIYLVHGLVLLLVFRLALVLQQQGGPVLFEAGGARLDFGNPWIADLATLGFLALTLLASAATYRWIEVPARDYFSRLARERIEQARATASPAS